MASHEDYAKILQEEIDRLRIKEEEDQKLIDALRSEFSNTNSPEEVLAVARKAIIDLMPKAIAEMGNLITGAESESVRASLSRFVVGCGLDKAKFEDSSSGELRELLMQLSKNDS